MNNNLSYFYFISIINIIIATFLSNFPLTFFTMTATTCVTQLGFAREI